MPTWVSGDDQISSLSPGRIEATIFRERIFKKLQSLPEILAQITSAFESNEFVELKRLCHRLCGEAATFGFEQLALAARRLEIATAHSDLEDLRDAQSYLMDCGRRIAV